MAQEDPNIFDIINDKDEYMIFKKNCIYKEYYKTLFLAKIVRSEHYPMRVPCVIQIHLCN